VMILVLSSVVGSLTSGLLPSATQWAFFLVRDFLTASCLSPPIVGSSRWAAVIVAHYCLTRLGAR
jgi:hypothetical protein